MSNYQTDNDPDGDGFREVSLTLYAHVPDHNPVQLSFNVEVLCSGCGEGSGKDFSITNSIAGCIDLTSRRGQLNVPVGTVTFSVPNNAISDQDRRIQYDGHWFDRCNGPVGWSQGAGAQGIPLTGTGAEPAPNPGGGESPGGSSPCVLNCFGGGGSGEGDGDEGAGEGNQGQEQGGGSSSSSAAKRQSNQSNTIPTQSPRGEQQEQPGFEPNPFYDGKEYGSGSSQDTLGSSASQVGKRLFKSWYIVLAAFILGGLAGLTYWWWLKSRA